ncbi:PspC domain-containing protein [Nocardia sp. ET3-3]|uniref:PspC domain-containing protein n=1 Tax=Nocardia terrae TaxID=2675851 RepID=A0A7K1UX21_9NOCA|nr:PspC domain-containing protein [Nocardia terrae]MVU78852.1 PspC domain-containing protein [Nocardia terrae]
MTRTSDWSKGAGRTGFSDQLHDLWQTRPVRFSKDGPIAGVCVGFGRRYNVDPVLVRVAFVVSALFGGAGIVLYLACWLLLNQVGDQSSAAESLFGRGRSSQNSSKTIVLMVALGIAVTTVGPVGVGLGGSGVISFALMLAGWWLLYQRQPQPPAAYFEQASADSILNTGYPGTTNPFWTGYPGTNAVTFETYGPYTTLPDHYEPDPNQPQSSAQSAAAQSMSQTGTEQFMAQTGPGEADTAVLRTGSADPDTAVLNPESPTAQDLPGEAVTEVLDTRYAPASSVTDTVVLHKPGSASRQAASAPAGGSAESSPSDPQSETQAAANAAGPVRLDKTAASNAAAPAENPVQPDTTDAPATDTPATGEAQTPPTGSTPETLGKPRTLHRIPSSGDRPRAGYGPAPISPDFGPTPPGWDPLGVSPLAWDLPEPGAPVQQSAVQAPARRPRSRLTVLTIGLAILAAAAAGSVAASGVDWMTPGRIGAAALAVIALGLIIGAFLRRGYGLMVLLAPLAGFVILASMVGPIEFDKGAMGDHQWTAATSSELLPSYHVSMGSGTLDLSKLQLTEDRAVEVKVRMGDARVILPPNLRVNTTCNVRMGDSNCLSGLSGPATGPVLNLTVDVQMGNAEVNRG